MDANRVGLQKISVTPLLKVSAALLSLFFLATVSAIPAHAEVYLFDQGTNNSFTSAQIIKNPQYFQYLYGIIGPGEDTVDYYQLEFAEFSPQVHIEVLIQDKKDLQEFKPSLVFIDSKLDYMIGKVPFSFPLNVGGRVYAWENLADKKHTDETVLENFVVGPTFIRDMAEGQYKIAIFDPNEKGGKYVLRIGSTKAPQSLQGKFAAVIAMLRIKFGLY